MICKKGLNRQDNQVRVRSGPIGKSTTNTHTNIKHETSLNEKDRAALHPVVLYTNYPRIKKSLISFVPLSLPKASKDLWL